MLNDQESELIRKYLSTRPVLRAFLFGSEARNAAQEGSDLDILVELDYSKKIGLDYFKMEEELSNLLHRKVDLLSAGSLNRHLKPRIEKDKILLYERTAA